MSQGDLIFVVTFAKSLQSFRIRAEAVSDNSAKNLNITREWTRSI